MYSKCNSYRVHKGKKTISMLIFYNSFNKFHYCIMFLKGKGVIVEVLGLGLGLALENYIVENMFNLGK